MTRPTLTSTATVTGPAGGRLYVVATPIGNLGDVTVRALEILRTVPLIAAEDTRISRRLLARYDIPTHLVSFHARNAERRLPDLLDHLRAGNDLAIVTDAGTPGVSDPGEELVRAWALEDGSVVPIPGASAVLAAIVASGIAGPRWTFEGFLPRSGRDRRERLARIAADERGCVVYEAPGRVAATLADLARACGPDRPAAICRELTKLHEEVVRATLAELVERTVQGDLRLRGEFALVVGERRGVATGVGERISLPVGALDPAAALAAARAEVERSVAAGVARGEAARRVAVATGLPRRQLYGAGAARPQD